MTNLEIVRLLINDKGKIIFTDDADITAFLTLNGDNIYLAAAAALESYSAKLAGTESFTIGSYSQTSGTANILKLAAEYRKKAEELGISPDGNPAGFDTYAEVGYTGFNMAEIIKNKILNKGK